VPKSNLRVLLIAEAANPDWVSVPLVGWYHARALSEVVRAHVVTHVRNRSAIEKTGWRDGREFTALDSERVAAPMWRFDEWVRRHTGLSLSFATALAALPYMYFESIVWKRFGESIRRGDWDVVHRLTPLSPAIPSPIAERCRRAGVPFVWGPVNGGVPWPKQFRAYRRKEGDWLEPLRGLHRFLPHHASTRKNASAIIVGSMRTRSELGAYRERCVYIPENGIDPGRLPATAPALRDGPLRAAFVGRLVPCKGVDMLLEAAAPLVKIGRLVIDIIGDGPEMNHLRSLAAREGLGAGVTFAGWVAHDALAERLLGSQVFAFPSVREFGGGAVLEAMALGLVPIVVDHGGPGELVTEDTGYLVPLGSRAEIVAKLRAAFENAIGDPAHLESLGRRARERVEKGFTWSAKAEQVLAVYDWVTGRRTDKPELGSSGQALDHAT
jgi:glycosyltransferase involved in cell wall biosynthesis